MAKIKNILNGVKSLFVGLGVTGKAFCAENVTVIYPREEVTNLASYRGHIELVGKDADPAAPKCVACGLCAKVCPSGCYTILCPAPLAEGQTEPVLAPAPQKGVKTPAVFVMDFSLCSLCGLCIMSCASKAIRFSNHPYLVGFNRKDFQLDLIARLRERAPLTIAEVTEPQTAPAAAPAPQQPAAVNPPSPAATSNAPASAHASD
jgi:NADH-quinone oxidoreductase subunit I